MLDTEAIDTLGLSKIGKLINYEDYDKVVTYRYVFHEEQETVFFIVKSLTDEYCFTSHGIIHLDDNGSRDLFRHPFRDSRISGVSLSTESSINQAIEIKLQINGEPRSIYVEKTQVAEVNILYKVLYRISTIQQQNADYYELGLKSLEYSVNALNVAPASTSLSKQVEALNISMQNWQTTCYETYKRENFGEYYQLYINYYTASIQQ